MSVYRFYTIEKEFEATGLFYYLVSKTVIVNGFIFNGEQCLIKENPKPLIEKRILLPLKDPHIRLATREGVIIGSGKENWYYNSWKLELIPHHFTDIEYLGEGEIVYLCLGMLDRTIAYKVDLNNCGVLEKSITAPPGNFSSNGKYLSSCSNRICHVNIYDKDLKVKENFLYPYRGFIYNDILISKDFLVNIETDVRYPKSLEKYRCLRIGDKNLYRGDKLCLLDNNCELSPLVDGTCEVFPIHNFDYGSIEKITFLTKYPFFCRNNNSEYYQMVIKVYPLIRELHFLTFPDMVSEISRHLSELRLEDYWKISRLIVRKYINKEKDCYNNSSDDFHNLIYKVLFL